MLMIVVIKLNDANREQYQGFAGKNPKVRPHIADYFGKSGVSKWCITKPTYGWRATGEKPTEIKNDTTCDETPKTQGVHSGETTSRAPICKGMR